MATGKVVSAKADIPVQIVGALNSILSDVGKNVQTLVGVNNTLGVISRQITDMASTINVMAKREDERFKDVMERLKEEEAERIQRDPALAQRNRMRTLDVDLSERPLTN